MNRINQILAALGLLALTATVEFILRGISEDLEYCGISTTITLEWVYICYLQDKRSLK